MTPLRVAVQYNDNPAVIRALLQAGAEIEARDKSDAYGALLLLLDYLAQAGHMEFNRELSTRLITELHGCFTSVQENEQWSHRYGTWHVRRPLGHKTNWFTHHGLCSQNRWTFENGQDVSLPEHVEREGVRWIACVPEGSLDDGKLWTVEAMYAIYAEEIERYKGTGSTSGHQANWARGCFAQAVESGGYPEIAGEGHLARYPCQPRARPTAGYTVQRMSVNGFGRL